MCANEIMKIYFNAWCVCYDFPVVGSPALTVINYNLHYEKILRPNIESTDGLDGS